MIMDENNHRITVLEDDVSAVKSDTAILKSDVAQLKTDVAVILSNYVTKADLLELRTDVASLESKMLRWYIGGVFAMASVVIGAARFMR
ncbi:hypothetical protein CR105_25040 [Massilia eurypsychrophila]|uniref:Hemolysin XhlA n=1 Tax=Massilia eurypsychrophila TaxID=1485217 RepID=A0A2G8T8A3_9BURK|nr:hypothetical protein [Massilia eurypsychrophila]PIL42271.1 hypothetical protein CR105_25040 [Massilia eurypsychrophila]